METHTRKPAVVLVAGLLGTLRNPNPADWKTLKGGAINLMMMVAIRSVIVQVMEEDLEVVGEVSDEVFEVVQNVPLLLFESPFSEDKEKVQEQDVSFVMWKSY